MKTRQFICLFSAFSLSLAGCGGDEEGTPVNASSESAETLPSADEDTNSQRELDDPVEEDSVSGAEEPEAPEGSWWEACPKDSLEERLIDVGEVRLNVACRGEGPTIVFLHGFPEFHYGWVKVMDELADEFRLIAPDQRGYNLSDKPEELTAYELPKLTADIITLLPLISPDPVLLVAHDWGGPVGWTVAHTPEAHIRGFLSTNGPHPLRFADLIANDPEQTEASSYMEGFKDPLAEAFLTVETLTALMGDAIDEEMVEIYQAAWSQPGAITGGLNWYRANELTPVAVAPIFTSLLAEIPVPVRVMWGEDDEFVLSKNALELEPFAPELDVSFHPEVDHWIAHRIPGEIANALRELHDKTRP